MSSDVWKRLIKAPVFKNKYLYSEADETWLTGKNYASDELFDDTILPEGFQPKKEDPKVISCTCGSEATYGKNATHSDWCDISTSS